MTQKKRGKSLSFEYESMLVYLLIILYLIH